MTNPPTRLHAPPVIPHQPQPGPERQMVRGGIQRSLLSDDHRRCRGWSRNRRGEVVPTHPPPIDRTRWGPIPKRRGSYLHRRHLTVSQRARIAARLTNLNQGRPPIKGSTDPTIPVPIADAGAALDVSRASTIRANRIIEKAPEAPNEDSQGTRDTQPNCPQQNFTAAHHRPPASAPPTRPPPPPPPPVGRGTGARRDLPHPEPRPHKNAHVSPSFTRKISRRRT